MPVMIPMLLKMLGSTLLTMGMSLLTQKFMKRLIIAALEQIVKRTEDDWDNKLLNAAKEAWDKADEEAK